MRERDGYAIIEWKSVRVERDPGGEGEKNAMREGKGTMRAFLWAQGALYALFVSMDLLNMGRAGDPVKFCSILLCLAFCLFWAGRGGDRLVATAMAFTLCADFFLLALDRDYALGVGIFCAVQGLYLLRLCREMGRRPMLLLRAVLVMMGLTGLLWLKIFTPLNVLAAFYFANFLGNVLLAAKVPGLRGRLFFVGLALFLCCDICVGMHNVPQIVPRWGLEAARVGMWLFYLPGQVLIALSALPDSELRGFDHARK